MTREDMVGHRWSVLVVFAVLLAGTVPAGAIVGQTQRQPAADTVTVGGVQVEPDDVVLGVSLHADGNASWRVEYRMRLATQNETEAFEDLAADIRQNPDQYTSEFASQMRATAQAAENETGREMQIRNVTVTAEKRQLPQEYGVITYRFTWTNFAAVDGPRLRAGDALAQLFLDDETTLIVEWPTAYRVATVDPAPTHRRANAVIWEGPLEFTAGQPSLVVTSTGTPTPAPTPTSGPTTPGGPGVSPTLLLLAAVVLLVLGAGGVLYARGRRPFGGGTGPEAEAEAETTTTEPREPTEAGPAASSEELLSNEERVLNLLEEHGGRMKQQQIVQELDWTDAKTSQVISDLREEGDIETFRIGRENVVRLPEEE